MFFYAKIYQMQNCPNGDIKNCDNKPPRPSLGRYPKGNQRKNNKQEKEKPKRSPKKKH